jgi:outer membrane immunogenic protein
MPDRLYLCSRVANRGRGIGATMMQRQSLSTRGTVMKKPSLGIVALFALAGSGSVMAADLPPRVAYKAPPPVAAPVPYNWTGFYLGGHYGGGWARKAWEDRGVSGDELCFDDIGIDGGLCPLDAVGSLGDVGSHNAIGPLGGFQGGFNWQTGHFVFGIEGTYSFADLKGDHQNSVSVAGVFEDPDLSVSASLHDRFSTKVTGIATIAGRIGITSDLLDRTLFYVKGGAAYARDKYGVNSQFSANANIIGEDTFFAANGTGSWSGTQNRWGWMAGIGIEFGLFDNWSAFVEYDYLGFGTKTVRLNGSATATIDCQTDCNGEFPGTATASFSRDFRINESIQVVKLGLNYRFNWGKGRTPIVAGY